MSLAKLKERLNKIATKKNDDISMDVSELNTNTWLQKISSDGNKPEDWLEYLQLVKNEVTFPNNITKHNFLNDLYEKALQDIKSDSNRNNEAYARLFVEYAWLKSEYLADDVQIVFNQARAIVRKFAFVHIASAKFELESLGNKFKALKILEKAVLFEAKPTEDLKEAIANVKSGKEIAVKLPEMNLPTVARKHLRLSPEDTSRKISSSISPSQSESHSLLDSAVQPRLDNPVEDRTKDPGKPHLPPHEENLTAEPCLVGHQDHSSSSCAKPRMRSFHSTPVLNSERKGREFGLPMRVKRPINLPFSELVENEEHEFEDTMDSFKPLETHHGNGVLGVSHASTSGYQSMSQLTDYTDYTEVKAQPKRQDITEDKLLTDPIVAKQSLKPVTHMSESKLKQRFKPMIELPEPKLMKPIPEIPSELQSLHKPISQVRQTGHSDLPVNPMLCTPSMKGMGPGSVVPNTPLANMEIITVNGEQYGILGVMGKGGSSKVYKVFDSQRVVKAVKVVDLDNANSIIVDGYKNEIHLLKRLQYCDKVIKMYDHQYDTTENKLYVVMEAGSEDLASFFKSRTKDRRPLSDNLIRFYWEVMLEAVQALHREGIIHSDLKPANFLLVGGNLKLIDFGIAKALQQDKTGVILETQIGTLNYMSPEAIKDFESCGDGQGKPKFKIGVKSDVWSLGCILYNMVYGRTPFQNLRHDFSKLQAIINPDFPIEFPDLPNKHLMDVMKRCLCRDPKSRPSIDELLQHPYVTGDSSEEVTDQHKEKIINKKMEALVSSLASQYSLSPGGVISLISKTMDTNQNSPAEAFLKAKDKDSEKKTPCSSSNDVPVIKPSLINRPQGPVTVKQMRVPLQSLSLQVAQGESNRNPSGS